MEASPMKRLIFLVLSTVLLVFAASAAAGPDSNVVGAAYTISNATSGNALIVYDRSADGSLTPAGSVPAGGFGTGVGLASQGAVTLTDHGHTVLAVNPGSNSVAPLPAPPPGPPRPPVNPGPNRPPPLPRPPRRTGAAEHRALKRHPAGQRRRPQAP